jgi:hypothetical protein
MNEGGEGQCEGGLVDNFKSTLVARMQIVSESLTKQNIGHRLVGIDPDSFWFHLRDNVDLASLIVGLYEKWADAAAIYINMHSEGRFLVCQFFLPAEICDHTDARPY